MAWSGSGSDGNLRLAMAEPVRVLMITSEWPTPARPHDVPFIVRQVNFLRKAGVDLDLFPFRGGKNPLNYARAWRQVRQVIKANTYDLIHVQWGQSGLLALPKPNRLPLVVTFRGDDLEGIIGGSGRKNLPGWILQVLSSQVVARAADQVILVSESLAQKIPTRSYHIIPSGLDLSLFKPVPQEAARKKLALSLDCRYILFAGSINNPRKRYWLAQQAVEILKDEMPVELISASGIPHEAVAEYINAADVLLLTSVHEGSPNVVKEALACNVPVVSTDVGDVRQRINGIPGSVILPDDSPQTIASALRNVLTRKERADSRSTILDLDERILTHKVLNVYKEVLNR